jgi:hypothetical protein
MGDVSFAADERTTWRLPFVREAVLCTGIAAITASLLVWLGLRGGDLAAHEYQRHLFLLHGFTLWDNFWYAGRYAFVNYSVLYYRSPHSSESDCCRCSRSRSPPARSPACSNGSGVPCALGEPLLALLWPGDSGRRLPLASASCSRCSAAALQAATLACGGVDHPHARASPGRSSCSSSCLPG